MASVFQEVLEGRFVRLRRVTPEDSADIFKWRSGHSGRFLRQPEDYSIESQRAWIESRPDTEINYIIVDKKSNASVGAIGIYDVNHTDLVSNVGRLLLDEIYLKQSNPYGLEALLLTYDFVLNRMNFRKITGEVLGVNAPMIKLQIFLGMTVEGVLKNHVHLNDKFEDMHILSIFKNDFNCKFKKKVTFLLKSFL